MPSRPNTLALLLCISGVPAAAQVYAVTGVATSDTLNLREDIGRFASPTGAPVIDRLPADATGLAATGLFLEVEGSVWREVTWRGQTGWLNEAYLRLTDLPDLPERLACSGTEPFWDLDIDGQIASFREMAMDTTTPLSVTASLSAIGRSNLWSFEFQGPNGQQTAIVEYTQDCSDGMSEFGYDYEIFLTNLWPKSGPVQGCCALAD